MCVNPTRADAFPQQQVAGVYPAHALDPQQRQQLAIHALAETTTITELARGHQVSRKFVYRQTARAQQALDEAFAAEADDDEVLFWLPVTKAWLRQLILGLLLICHSSMRGVVELLRDVFDFDLSLGTVCAIAQKPVPLARTINSQQNLAGVAIGALDEIFQGRQPVLVGADIASTYCYLLSLEEQRDGDTWAIRLLELQERGFAPKATIADFGAGLRAGQKLVMPEVPCRGDVFHALQDLEQAVRLLEERAYQAIHTRSKLEHKQAEHRRRNGQADRQISQKLRHAGPGEAQAIALAEEVAILVRWLREDVFAVNGLAYADRCTLYNFVVAELRARIALCPQRLQPLCTLLQQQRSQLLAFAAQLDEDLGQIAQELQVPLDLVRRMLDVEQMPSYQARRWPQEAVLRQQLRGRFHAVREAVAQVAQRTVRASSVIENLNSRLRNYFFLRRQLGPDYLVLLQFFLNHRRFLRSEHPERVGKSPAELLTGQRHPHWLEMLGFTRFSRN